MALSLEEYRKRLARFGRDVGGTLREYPETLADYAHIGTGGMARLGGKLTGIGALQEYGENAAQKGQEYTEMMTSSPDISPTMAGIGASATSVTPAITEQATMSGVGSLVGRGIQGLRAARGATDAARGVRAAGKAHDAATRGLKLARASGDPAKIKAATEAAKGAWQAKGAAGRVAGEISTTPGQAFMAGARVAPEFGRVSAGLGKGARLSSAMRSLGETVQADTVDRTFPQVQPRPRPAEVTPETQTVPTQQPTVADTNARPLTELAAREIAAETPDLTGTSSPAEDPRQEAINRITGIKQEFEGTPTSADMRGAAIPQDERGVFVAGQPMTGPNAAATNKLANMRTQIANMSTQSGFQQQVAPTTDARGQAYAERRGPDGQLYVVGSREDPDVLEQYALEQRREATRQNLANGGLEQLQRENQRDFTRTAGDIAREREKREVMSQINQMPEGQDKQDALASYQDELTARRRADFTGFDRFEGSVGSPGNKAREQKMADYKNHLNELTKNRVISKKESEQMARQENARMKQEQKHEAQLLNLENQAQLLSVRADELRLAGLEERAQEAEEKVGRLAESYQQLRDYTQFGVSGKNFDKFRAAESAIRGQDENEEILTKMNAIGAPGMRAARELAADFVESGAETNSFKALTKAIKTISNRIQK